MKEYAQKCEQPVDCAEQINAISSGESSFSPMLRLSGIEYRNAKTYGVCIKSPCPVPSFDPICWKMTMWCPLHAKKLVSSLTNMVEFAVLELALLQTATKKGLGAILGVLKIQKVDCILCPYFCVIEL